MPRPDRRDQDRSLARRGILAAGAVGVVGAALATSAGPLPLSTRHGGMSDPTDGRPALDASGRVPLSQLPVRTAASGDDLGADLQTELVLNVYDFGVPASPASGDFTAQLQSVIDRAGELTAQQTRPVTVTIPYGFVNAAGLDGSTDQNGQPVSGVVLSDRMVSLTGPGELRGTIIAGTGSGRTQFDSAIRHLRIAPPQRADGIVLRSASRLRITGCTFVACRAGVMVAPDPGIDGLKQLTSRITIDRNRFDDVDYALQSRNHRNAAGEVDVSWMAAADLAFEDNIVNAARIAHVDLESVDGAIISRNQLFFPSASTSAGAEKTSSIVVGTSNWLIVADNHLFEPGQSGIALTNPQSVTITGNHIAWAGERLVSAAITVTRDGFDDRLPLRGLIEGNTALDHSGSAVQFSGLLEIDQFTIGAANVFSSSVRDDSKRAYVGSDSIPWPHSRVVVTDGAAPAVALSASIRSETESDYAESDVLPGGAVHSLSRLGLSSAMSSTSATATVSSAGPTRLARLSSADGREPYGGMIIVEARADQDVDLSPSSQYVLLVSRYGWSTSDSPGQTGYSCRVLGAAEMDDMVETSPAKPVFDFTIDADGLAVQPRAGAPTAGSFVFAMTALGNVVALS